MDVVGEEGGRDDGQPGRAGGDRRWEPWLVAVELGGEVALPEERQGRPG
jgi:hypothetical protein